MPRCKKASGTCAELSHDIVNVVGFRVWGLGFRDIVTVIYWGYIGDNGSYVKALYYIMVS